MKRKAAAQKGPKKKRRRVRGEDEQESAVLAAEEPARTEGGAEGQPISVDPTPAERPAFANLSTKELEERAKVALGAVTADFVDTLAPSVLLHTQPSSWSAPVLVGDLLLCSKRDVVAGLRLNLLYEPCDSKALLPAWTGAHLEPRRLNLPVLSFLCLRCAPSAGDRFVVCSHTAELLELVSESNVPTTNGCDRAAETWGLKLRNAAVLCGELEGLSEEQLRQLLVHHLIDSKLGNQSFVREILDVRNDLPCLAATVRPIQEWPVDPDDVMERLRRTFRPPQLGVGGAAMERGKVGHKNDAGIDKMDAEETEEAGETEDEKGARGKEKEEEGKEGKMMEEVEEGEREKEDEDEEECLSDRQVLGVLALIRAGVSTQKEELIDALQYQFKCWAERVQVVAAGGRCRTRLWQVVLQVLREAEARVPGWIELYRSSTDLELKAHQLFRVTLFRSVLQVLRCVFVSTFAGKCRSQMLAALEEASPEMCRLVEGTSPEKLREVIAEPLNVRPMKESTVANAAVVQVLERCGFGMELGEGVFPLHGVCHAVGRHMMDGGEATDAMLLHALDTVWDSHALQSLAYMHLSRPFLALELMLKASSCVEKPRAMPMLELVLWIALRHNYPVRRLSSFEQAEYRIGLGRELTSPSPLAAKAARAMVYDFHDYRLLAGEDGSSDEDSDDDGDLGRMPMRTQQDRIFLARGLLDRGLGGRGRRGLIGMRQLIEDAVMHEVGRHRREGGRAEGDGLGPRDRATPWTGTLRFTQLRTAPLADVLPFYASAAAISMLARDSRFEPIEVHLELLASLSFDATVKFFVSVMPHTTDPIPLFERLLNMGNARLVVACFYSWLRREGKPGVVEWFSRVVLRVHALTRNDVDDEQLRVLIRAFERMAECLSDAHADEQQGVLLEAMHLKHLISAPPPEPKGRKRKGKKKGEKKEEDVDAYFKRFVTARLDELLQGDFAHTVTPMKVDELVVAAQRMDMPKHAILLLLRPITYKRGNPAKLSTSDDVRKLVEAAKPLSDQQLAALARREAGMSVTSTFQAYCFLHLLLLRGQVGAAIGFLVEFLHTRQPSSGERLELGRFMAEQAHAAGSPGKVVGWMAQLTTVLMLQACQYDDLDKVVALAHAIRGVPRSKPRDDAEGTKSIGKKKQKQKQKEKQKQKQKEEQKQKQKQKQSAQADLSICPIAFASTPRLNLVVSEFLNVYTSMDLEYESPDSRDKLLLTAAFVAEHVHADKVPSYPRPTSAETADPAPRSPSVSYSSSAATASIGSSPESLAEPTRWKSVAADLHRKRLAYLPSWDAFVQWERLGGVTDVKLDSILESQRYHFSRNSASIYRIAMYTGRFAFVRKLLPSTWPGSEVAEAIVENDDGKEMKDAMLQRLESYMEWRFMTMPDDDVARFVHVLQLFQKRYGLSKKKVSEYGSAMEVIQPLMKLARDARGAARYRQVKEALDEARSSLSDDYFLLVVATMRQLYRSRKRFIELIAEFPNSELPGSV